MKLFKSDEAAPKRAYRPVVQKTWVEPRPVRELPPPQELDGAVQQVPTETWSMETDSKWHPNLTTLEATLADHAATENDKSNLDRLAERVAALTWEEMQVVAQHVAARLSADDAKVDEYAVAASLNAWKNAWQRPEREEPPATSPPAATQEVS